MIDICISLAGPLVVFAVVLSRLCNATRSGVLVGRGTRTLTKRIVISGRPAGVVDDDSLELAKVTKLREIVGVAPKDDQTLIADYVNEQRRFGVSSSCRLESSIEHNSSAG